MHFLSEVTLYMWKSSELSDSKLTWVRWNKNSIELW